jgi:hypothetical protein
MPDHDDLMRFTDITHQVENTYSGETAFLTENLDKAVAQCAKVAYANGVTSSLTLSIQFQRGKGEELIIRAALSSKLPNPKPFPITAFVDREGQLVKEDPKQRRLEGGGIEQFTARRTS